ncbi:MAG: hypothetical protein HND58_13025 [Planctomycetota bacterium]|nr:MAG: hypothetical protein HND58_13025 [Planctomycetota bacterium]
MTLKLTNPDPRPNRLPQVLLDIAAEVEADETRIKREVLEAARAKDHDRVITIVEQWIAKPPSEVLSHALIDASEER